MLLLSLTLGVSLAVSTPARADDQAQSDVPRMADVVITGIELYNPDSSRKRLGSGLGYITDEHAQHLFTQYYSKTGHELLTLFAGSTVKFKRSFKGYEIQHMDKKFLTARRVLRDVKQFETGKGIHLGISRGKLEEILGNPSRSSSADGSEVVHYELTDPNSSFLSQYSAKSYTADYTFTHGALTDAKVDLE
jgi:hypothetical protein